MEKRMLRRSAFLIHFVLCLTLSTNAYAEGSGIYVGGIAGLSLRSDTLLSSPVLGNQVMEFSPGYTFGGFVGYDFDNHFRLEGELSYRENRIRTGGGQDPQAITSSMMINGFYDIPLGKPFNGLPFTKYFNLYVGGGFGVATAQLETISLGEVIDANETLFAYQVEGGIGWTYNPKVNFSLGYRFFDAADPEFVLRSGQRARMDLSTHELILKMRYIFNL